MFCQACGVSCPARFQFSGGWCRFPWGSGSSCLVSTSGGTPGGHESSRRVGQRCGTRTGISWARRLWSLVSGSFPVFRRLVPFSLGKRVFVSRFHPRGHFWWTRKFPQGGPALRHKNWHWHLMGQEVVIPPSVENGSAGACAVCAGAWHSGRRLGVFGVESTRLLDRPSAKPPDHQRLPTPWYLPYAGGRAGCRHTHPTSCGHTPAQFATRKGVLPSAVFTSLACQDEQAHGMLWVVQQECHPLAYRPGFSTVVAGGY
ncbi:hypothetical protein HNQ65_001342 [Prosthecobacter vanneervenii]|uniref:Uncharacterized protein n=1 Tax=Prosthecobacter vanneervenii TaxID=48466 RepID=A0A7W8DJ52_9BACT|nr:hypothetical protein [Prosthecobacter vanneervenii]